MLNIKVLGPGCAKCYALERVAANALETMLKENPDLEATLQHIEDPLEIQEYPILFTPGLVVNEKLVCAGRVPSKKEVLEWYRAALNHST
jgi:small redox-active disulfide protein 2